VSAKYAFIAAEKATKNRDGSVRYQVRQMCRWMGVSRSGFHEWVSRPVSATRRWRDELGLIIEHLFDDHDGTYGYRRIHAALVRAGRWCDPDTVRSIMAARGLVACPPRSKRRCTTRQAAEVADIPDLLGRDFTAEAPGAKLVGDITYVATGEGWLYVALVVDCFSRAIVGWAMADHYQTPLITEAVAMAARRVHIPDQAIFHSDRGSNYAAITRQMSTPRSSIASACGAPWVAPGCVMTMLSLNPPTVR
jgi:putative transposase